METLKNLTLSQVQTLAQMLAQQFEQQGGVLGLTGELGAGKTTFTKAFLRELGIKNTSSPTFVVAHEYQTAGRKVYHLDFYRMQKSAELKNLGLEEMAGGKNLVLIEWIDKFPALAKQCSLIINFKVRPNNLRDVKIKFN